MEVYSFEDAQRNPSLLNPVEDDLSSTFDRQVNVRQESSTSSSNNNERPSNGIHLGDPRLMRGGVNGNFVKQITVEANGSSHQMQRNGIQAEAEARLQRQREELREARKKEKEADKRRRALIREGEERRMAIEEAINDRRRIISEEVKCRKEKTLLADLTAGRSGNEALGRQVIGLWQSLRPTKNQLAQRQSLIKDAQTVIDQKWPGCGLKLAPFGSTQTGLVENMSDLDLTLLDPMRPHGIGTPADEVLQRSPEISCSRLADSLTLYGIANLPDYYSVGIVASALRRQGEGKFIRVSSIAKAKVPIVKLVHASSGLASDININDAFGNINSEMISAYCDYDTEIVRPFLFVIKKWASRRGINDPSGVSGACSLNSYTICMIALQFLQIQGVVPNLQDADMIAATLTPKTYLWQKPPTSRYPRSRPPAPQPVKGGQVDPMTGARRFDTTFVRLDMKAIQSDGVLKAQLASLGLPRGGPISWKMSILERQTKIGQLLKSFFIWFCEFDFDEGGISIRLGRPFRKQPIPRNKELSEWPLLEAPSKQWKMNEPILCQDPFILDRNTAGAINRDTRQIIIDEAWRARALLEEERGSDVALLFDLISDYNHEELSSRHAIQIQSFDAATKNHINKMASQPRSRR